MGFLEDIGRTNTLAHTGDMLLRGANQLAQMEAQGPQQQFRNAIAMKQIQMQQNEENMKMAEFNRKIAQEEKFIPATMVGIDPNKPTPSQQQLIKELTDAKIAEVNNGVLGIRQKNMPLVNQYFNNYPDRLLTIGIMHYNELSQQLLNEKDLEKKKAILEQMNAQEQNINKLRELASKKEQQSFAPKGYSAEKVGGKNAGLYPFNKDTGTLGGKLGDLPPQATTNPVVLDNRRLALFTQQYNSRMNNIKARALNTSRKYGLTREEAMMVAEGDSSIITRRMTPEQADAYIREMKSLDEEFRNLDDAYNRGLDTGHYRWEMSAPKPKQEEKKKLTYDPETGTFK